MLGRAAQPAVRRVLTAKFFREILDASEVDSRACWCRLVLIVLVLSRNVASASASTSVLGPLSSSRERIPGLGFEEAKEVMASEARADKAKGPLV